MRRKGVSADEVTMNSILDGLASCFPPRVREAETVVALMTGWGLKPNQVRYHADPFRSESVSVQNILVK